MAGSDSFADIMSFAGASTLKSNNKKHLESMTMKERQEYLKSQNKNQGNKPASSGANNWASGLDLLSGLSPSPSPSPTPASGAQPKPPSSFAQNLDLSSSIAGGSSSSSSSSTKLNSIDSSVSSSTKNTTFQENNSPKNSNDSNNDFLLDVDIPPSSTKAQNESSVQETASDDIDDIFDIFNKPPPPKPAQSKLDQTNGKVGNNDASSSNTPPKASEQKRRPRQERRQEERETFSDDFNEEDTNVSSTGNEKLDHAIAELIDMGFSVEQATTALRHTKTGTDVRQAIDYLMSEAHRKATGQPPSQPSRGSSSSSRSQTPDISKLAQDLSSQFLSAGISLFNQSKKTINKAIETYAHQDDGTPAWMRDAQKYKNPSNSGGSSSSHSKPAWDKGFTDEMPHRPRPKPKSRSPPKEQFKEDSNITNEARALDSDRPDRHARSSRQASMSPSALHSRPQRQAKPEPSLFKDDDDEESAPQLPQRRRESPQSVSSSSSLSSMASSRADTPRLTPAQQFKMKASLIGESEDSYISPARRRQREKKAAASQPPAQPKVERPIVTIPSATLDMVNVARQSGTEAFKRGDFTQSETFYTQALASIPPNHLLRTILLSNRAAVYLKLGNSKAALTDANEGIEIIGPSLGAGEFAEPGKPLKDIWSKLMMRQAEANESLERFKDSLAGWSALIENGYSSKTAMDGKRRCLSVLEPKKPAAPKKPAQQHQPRKATTTSSSQSTEPSAARKEALKKIRDANAQAEKEDDEKYKLMDAVEARIEAWRKGKEDNLRALLANLDTVLWPSLGWKKVTMADLVLPKKVKIIYMKAVAKTHPDKIPGSANVEQKMIAQSVFVTINKAWDGFKVTNQLN